MNKDAFITPIELQEMLRITRATEIKWRRAGILPKPMILRRRVYYLRTDVEKLHETQA